MILSYLDYLREKFDENQNFKGVTTHELRDKLKIDSEETRILGELLYRDIIKLYGVRAGNLRAENWDVGVLDDIEKLDAATSSQEFLLNKWNDYIEGTTTPRSNTSHNILSHKPLAAQVSDFVDHGRLEELASITSEEFDLSKLIMLCKEIDTCYRNECYFAVAMLIRSILDHVPPIFMFRTFAEVANNYGGTRSFKQSMQNLENSSRNIADSHLHVQIRKRESLPNKVQVNFSNDLDVLLGEIIRLLK